MWQYSGLRVAVVLVIIRIFMVKVYTVQSAKEETCGTRYREIQVQISKGPLPCVTQDELNCPTNEP